MSSIPTQFKATINNWVPFEDEELAQFASLFQKQTLKKGSQVLGFGKMAKHLIFIEKGLLRKYYLEKGSENTTWMLPEGHFLLSLRSFRDNTPSRYAIECIEDCELYLLPKEKHQTLLKENSKVSYFISLLQMTYLCNYEHRLKVLRTQDATTRYRNFLISEKEIASRVSQKHIASYLAMDVTTLSKIRRRMRNKGL